MLPNRYGIPRNGRMRMSDVINCTLYSLVGLVSEFSIQKVLADQVSRGGVVFSDTPDDVVSDDYRERLQSWLDVVGSAVVAEFELQKTQWRIECFRKVLAKPGATYRDVSTQLNELTDALQGDMQGQLVYRYPEDKAALFKRWKSDWEAVLDAFPEAGLDVYSGVDLFALGHYTASVFHHMRVLEHGLAALADAVDVVPGERSWYNIINDIEAGIRREEKSLPRGSERVERLQFLSEAAKEFVYFKHGWRNYVSHNKCIYTEVDGRTIMEHVRCFMTSLARGLSR